MAKSVGVGVRVMIGLMSIGALVALCAFAGFYGISELSKSADSLTGPVWNTTNGALESRIGVQSQMLVVSRSLQSGNLDSHLDELKRARAKTDLAVQRLSEAGLLDDAQRGPFVDALNEYDRARREVLDMFSAFQSADRTLATDFFDFQDFMADVQQIGDRQVEDLALNPNEPISWVNGLRSRWGVAKAAMESNIQLLARFYHYQRLLDAVDHSEEKLELDYYLGLLEQSLGDLGSHRNFAQLKVTTGDLQNLTYVEALDSLVRKHREGFDAAVAQFVKLKESQALYLQASREVLAQAETIMAESEEQFVSQASWMEEVKWVAYIVLAAALAMSLLAALILGFVNVRLVAKPLAMLTRSARRVLNNDLADDDTLAQLAAGKTQFSELATVFIAQREALRGMVGNLKQGAGDLVRSGTAIGATAQQAASSATEQAATASEVSSTVAQLLQTSRTAASSATSVLQSADNASERGRHGLESVEEAQQTMGVISDRISEVASKVLELSEQTSRIDSILTTVNNLAEQSNLLAVNASIEASKAGDEGRGFAVVADEVRNLAEQSKRSTQQIRIILADIQGATQSAVMSAEEGTKRAADGRAAITSASQVITDLAAVLDDASDRARQITSASSEQTAGVQEIVRAMESVEQASSHSAEGARELQGSAQELNSVAKRMEQLTAQYQL